MIENSKGRTETPARLPSFLQPPLPSVFTFEITTRCQHHCLGCGNVFSHSHQELPFEHWGEIIDKLRPYAQALRITGGEPTLHKQFFQIIEKADSLGIPFVLFTNGNWPNPQSIVEALTRCKNLNGVLFSLHGHDRVSFRLFTGVDAFDSVLSSIKMTVAAGLKVATNTLLLTTTTGHVNHISDKVLSLGASTASFGRYYGPPIPDISPDSEQLTRALLEIANIHTQDPRIKLSNCVPNCFLPGVDFGGNGCTSGFTHCTVGPGGEVRPCTHTPTVLGHLPEDSIEEIWASQTLDVWRRRVPEPCLSCEALSTCRGGCRALAEQLHLLRDPLMNLPLLQFEPQSLVELALDDRPLLDCTIHPMEFGFALVGAGSYVTLSHKSGSIMDALNGNTTIEQLQNQFGPASLELVGSLFKKRLVRIL